MTPRCYRCPPIIPPRGEDDPDLKLVPFARAASAAEQKDFAEADEAERLAKMVLRQKPPSVKALS